MIRNLNKVLAGCILVISLLFVTSIAMAATNPAKIAGTNVNVRKSPSTTAGIVTKLSNSKVTILDKSNGWYKVSFDKRGGWVNGNYVKVTAVKGKINANGVNFRQSASTSSKKLGTLNKTAGIEILDTSSGWNKVKIGSKVGYVASNFVTAVAAASSTAASAKSTAKTSRAVSVMALDISEDANESIAAKVINYAKEFIGVRYVYGGSSPRGFDCSGFIAYVYKNFGINLNRSAAAMYSNGVKVSKSQLETGDILFFDASSRKASGIIDHAGIYMGNGMFIHASSSNGEVRTQKLSEYKGTYLGAKRVLK